MADCFDKNFNSFKVYIIIIFFKWDKPGLFFVYFGSFQTNINTILQQINVKNVMSIQYMVLGFEP